MDENETPVSATVISRIERLNRAELVGMTIAQVRENFGSVLNIPERATPQIDNEVVDEDYVLQADDEVVFNLPVGEKG